MSFTFGNTFGTTLADQIADSIRTSNQLAIERFHSGMVVEFNMADHLLHDMIDEKVDIENEDLSFVPVNETDTLVITQYKNEEAFAKEINSTSVKEMLKQKLATIDYVGMKLGITVRNNVANRLASVQSKKLVARNRANGFAR